jgi:hypothetical protein
MYIKFYSLNLTGRDHLVQLSTNEEIKFKWIYEKSLSSSTEFKWLGLG